MYIYIILIIIFILSIFFWLSKVAIWKNINYILICLTSILGGIFGGICLYHLSRYINTDSVYYSAVIGPILEETIKFIIIFFIFANLNSYFTKPAQGLLVGVFVGLGFGGLENVLYIQQGLSSRQIIIYRAIFVGGIILHPLTAGIMGYMLCITYNFSHYIKHKLIISNSTKSIIRNFFVIEKNKLGKELWKNFLIYGKIIIQILILDITITYILSNNYLLNKSKKNTTNLEIIGEGFFLALWIHMIYNTILTYFSIPNVYLAGIGIILLIILLRLFIGIYESKYVGYAITSIILLGFVLPSNMGDKFLLLGLNILLVSLFILAYNLTKKISN